MRGRVSQGDMVGGEEVGGSWNNVPGGHHSRELGALRGRARDWEYASRTMTLTVLARLQLWAENWTKVGGYSCIFKLKKKLPESVRKSVAWLYFHQIQW